MIQTRALIMLPTQEVVTLAEAKAQCNITFGDDDTLVGGLISVVVNYLDAAGGGWLGRALRPQVWEYRLAGFDCELIGLPFPPFVSMTSVKYDDNDGVETTLAVTTGYRVLGSGSLNGAKIAPPFNGAWPTARADYESVRIRYTAGYDSADTRGDLLPKPIKQAVLRMINDLYDNRGDAVIGTINSEIQMSATVESLLAPYRAFWF